jgi:hypothetical protein
VFRGADPAKSLTTARLPAGYSELDALCVPIDTFFSGAARAIAESGRKIPQDVRSACRQIFFDKVESAGERGMPRANASFMPRRRNVEGPQRRRRRMAGMSAFRFTPHGTDL